MTISQPRTEKLTVHNFALCRLRAAQPELTGGRFFTLCDFDVQCP